MLFKLDKETVIVLIVSFKNFIGFLTTQRMILNVVFLDKAAVKIHKQHSIRLETLHVHFQPNKKVTSTRILGLRPNRSKSNQ